MLQAEAISESGRPRVAERRTSDAVYPTHDFFSCSSVLLRLQLPTTSATSIRFAVSAALCSLLCGKADCMNMSGMLRLAESTSD